MYIGKGLPNAILIFHFQNQQSGIRRRRFEVVTLKSTGKLTIGFSNTDLHWIQIRICDLRYVMHECYVCDVCDIQDNLNGGDVCDALNDCGAGVYISVRKQYLFPPPLLKMIFFPPLATCRFSTSIVAFFP